MLPEVISISVTARAPRSWTIFRFYRFSFHDTNSFITHKIAPKCCRTNALMDSFFLIRGIPDFLQIIRSSLTRLMRCWRYVNIAKIFNDKSVWTTLHWFRWCFQYVQYVFLAKIYTFMAFLKQIWMKFLIHGKPNMATRKRSRLTGIDDGCQLSAFHKRTGIFNWHTSAVLRKANKRKEISSALVYI